MKSFLSFVLLIIASQALAQPINEIISRGNEYYRKQDYQRAYNEYQKVLDLEPGNSIAKFNQANCLYQQQQKVEAAKLFSSLISSVPEKPMRAAVFYNRGVILSDQKNLEESIEAYKNALRNDPDDKLARENLQKALSELKKKPQPNKEDNKEDKKKQQQQQKQPQKMNQNESQQRLKLLQQKEKEVQERIQNEKNKGAGGSNNKDW